MGDCEVSDWVAGPCSVDCGPQGGFQNVTREILSIKNGLAPEAAKCPPLRLYRACNKVACPQDCEMEAWGSWSQCSRTCGGGVRTRSRNVKQQAFFGGIPCGGTLQEEVCNPQPCDQDCEFGGWTEWSGCSKSCRGGHQVLKNYLDN